MQGHGHQREVARGAPVFVGAHARRRGHAARRCSACVCIPPLWSRRRGGTSNGIRCGRRGGTEPSPADGPPTDFAVAPRLRVRNDAATQRDAALHAPGHDPDRVTAAVARRTASSGGVAATRSRRRPWRPGANGRPAAAPRSTARPPPTARTEPPAPPCPVCMSVTPQHTGKLAGARVTPARATTKYHGEFPCGTPLASRVLMKSTSP